jgi:hypothetical protein
MQGRSNNMTLISILERKPVHPLPRCASCDAPALVATPAGLACQEHAVQDVHRSLQARDTHPIPGTSSQR